MAEIVNKLYSRSRKFCEIQEDLILGNISRNFVVLLFIIISYRRSNDPIVNNSFCEPIYCGQKATTELFANRCCFTGIKRR